MLPVFSWYARIMNLGSLNDKWFAIKKKTLLPTSKQPTSWAYTGNEKTHDAKNKNRNNIFFIISKGVVNSKDVTYKCKNNEIIHK